jgi:hypothetical protein
MENVRRYDLLLQIDEDYSESLALNVDLAGLMAAIVAADGFVVAGYALCIIEYLG